MIIYPESLEKTLEKRFRAKTINFIRILMAHNLNLFQWVIKNCLYRQYNSTKNIQIITFLDFLTES